MESTVMAEPLVIGLSKIAPGDGDRVGRKAANLAVLLQAGFPVPDGAVLTTWLTAAASQPARNRPGRGRRSRDRG